MGSPGGPKNPFLIVWIEYCLLHGTKWPNISQTLNIVEALTTSISTEKKNRYFLTGLNEHTVLTMGKIQTNKSFMKMMLWGYKMFNNGAAICGQLMHKESSLGPVDDRKQTKHN